MRTYPDFAVEAFEASLNTRSVEACEYAERIVHGYLSDAEKRGKLMAALSSEVMLNRSWERCRIYRRLATAALGYADSRETAVSVLGSVLSYRNAQPKERESALIKLWDQLLKGTDISVAEKDIVKVAANRNDLLFEAARGLLSDAKRLDFNRPEQKTLRMPIPAQVPLRLARSAATA